MGFQLHTIRAAWLQKKMADNINKLVEEKTHNAFRSNMYINMIYF